MKADAGGDPARAELDGEILEWMREPEWSDDDARFERLALALFAFQFDRCVPYRRFCEARGRTPRDVAHWSDIPAVPTGAFKAFELVAFPRSRIAHTFRTSGTSTTQRGSLHLDTLALYEASLLPSFQRHVFPELDGMDLSVRTRRPLLQVLAPSALEAPDSSLSHMFDVALRELGSPASHFRVRGGKLDVEALGEALREAIRYDEPVALCGTAFAFVHLLEALEAGGGRIALPAGSRVMETGGFKGKSRALARTDLYAAIEASLGVPATRIVNQYGMTELGSQFYDSVLRRPGEHRRKLRPPWTRVRLVDPETGGDTTPGAAGAIVVFDLANSGSVLALQTEDVGHEIGDGFDVVGREPGAEARGCSIVADAQLSSGTA